VFEKRGGTIEGDVRDLVRLQGFGGECGRTGEADGAGIPVDNARDGGMREGAPDRERGLRDILDSIR
jgi:hypothetical protein